MPLTEKGSKILSNMQEQYGKEKGEEVFYASKNKGTIKGVDARDVGAQSWNTPQGSGYEINTDVGAESWVGGRGNSTGYEINTAEDQGMALPTSTPIATPTNTSIAGVVPPGMATAPNMPTNLVTGDRHRVAVTLADLARAGGRK